VSSHRPRAGGRADAPLGVPSVTVIVEPVMTIVEPVNLLVVVV